jgi:hypothetical protein
MLILGLIQARAGALMPVCKIGSIWAARALFTRFGVAMQPNIRSVLDQVYVDFSTGKTLAN